MPAPENITPQTPGEAPANVEPNPLEALLNGNVPEVVNALPGLDDKQLADLADLEAAGQNRKGISAGIADELEARKLLAEQAAAAAEAEATSQPTPEPSPAPAARDLPSSSDGVVRVGDVASAVLTDAGWVVPEPLPNAQPKGN